MVGRYVKWELEFGEHHPITSPKFATYGDGRYVFILGNKRTSRDERIHYSRFELECIDLFLSVKTRYIIEGLQDIGFVLAFYAISPTSFMLIDYSELNANVKQTGIILDQNSFTGAHFIERTYCVATSVAFFFVHCIVGQQECVIFAPPNTRPETTFCCHLIPKLPWAKYSDRNCSSLIQRVNAQVLSQHGAALSRWESPQFISVNELAFFLDRGQGICPDPFNIAVVNIEYVFIIALEHIHIPTSFNVAAPTNTAAVMLGKRWKELRTYAQLAHLLSAYKLSPIAAVPGTTFDVANHGGRGAGPPFYDWTGDWRVITCTADKNTGFPRDPHDQLPIDSTALHSASGQISLLTTYGRPADSYYAHFARLLQRWSRHVWRAFYYTSDNFSWIAPMFLHLALAMTTMRGRLMYNPAAKVGVLDTTTWQWVEVHCVNDYYFTDIVTFDNGQTLIHQTDKNWNFEHYGIIRNPFTVPTLISTAELISRPIAYNEEREQLVKRLRQPSH
ncbi:hypothetical protein Y032_0068g209 [Ancylostoma ceylanicum]|nr:hypothetical protein Y032_0068g209 [Ancylostoma ceylanicum]